MMAQHKADSQLPVDRRESELPTQVSSTLRLQKPTQRIDSQVVVPVPKASYSLIQDMDPKHETKKDDSMETEPYIDNVETIQNTVILDQGLRYVDSLDPSVSPAYQDQELYRGNRYARPTASVGSFLNDVDLKISTDAEEESEDTT